MTANIINMPSILILGAGRSSSALISYLLNFGAASAIDITVGDVSLEAARERLAGSPHGKAIRFDINNTDESRKAIAQSSVVVSLIPAHLHPSVAKICLETGSHLLTASYVSDEMKGFDSTARSKSLLFLNECGLDPGIDHMSAMQVMDRIRSSGGKITSFESFTGGLIAPETDVENPWRYKFTWNARNVVMAGQSTAKFLSNGQYKYIPYQQLFSRITPVTVPGYGEYEGYANRDSLKYLETYGLHDVTTMLRGTLRNKGFCGAWNVLVQLGCCEDTYEMEQVASMTHKGFMNSFVNTGKGVTLQSALARTCGVELSGGEIQRLTWSGLFSEEKIGLGKGTPAQILEHVLNKKWKLQPNDKDLVVMWHRFGYELHGVSKKIEASLVAKGHDSVNTAMARTVGLPLGIAAKLLIQEKIKERGVVIPVSKDIYEPVLSELKSLGIELTEREA
ncbi:MAG TPA: saccharopine dehydrogenase C-terminal domain-containing protein [Cyclobacteriaceae bacterium]|nr:saccharopine dehydrogenase C-terminal domain-containing protein [Cyclobacteriaceae bacterium]